MIDGARFDEDALRARTRAVTVAVPARDEAASIEATVSALVGLRDRGAIDEVVVLGGTSRDDTDSRAAQAGADVRDVSATMRALGPPLGKGDTLWRGLSAVRTPVVVFVDADIDSDVAALACGLAGPLVAADRDPATRFVKGAFHRRHPDFVDEANPFDGGRVTELMARPLLNLLRPDLAGFYQPLGGQVAADTASLREIPFLTGYAVEIGMLVDIVDRWGLAAVAQVDLGELQNRPRPTVELAPMAQEVLYGFLLRAAPALLRDGWRAYRRPRYDGTFDVADVRVVVRPAWVTLDARDATG